MTAQIVLDCSFGDGGKGLVVDNLCDQFLCNSPLSKVLVVRFSGGQQCGHTVIRDGKKHIFSSFGSGTLRGCPTFCTEDTTMYLPNLIKEYDALTDLGVTPVLKFHPLAMMTTPYDVAYNRAKEQTNACHGSCGIGVGATMHRNNSTPYKLYVTDFAYPELLYAKLKQISTYYSSRVNAEANNGILDFEVYKKERDWIEDIFFDSLKSLEKNQYFVVGTQPYISKDTQVIFEGSQGIMLDMDHGVFPNVTYANTTCKNAMKYVYKWQIPAEIYYVTRCYLTRHGLGWMPNESAIELVNNEEEINKWNFWQDHLRYGEFDYALINHAMAIDSAYHYYQIKKNLVITCLDQRPDFRVDRTYKASTDLKNVYVNDSPHSGHMKLL